MGRSLPVGRVVPAAVFALHCAGIVIFGRLPGWLGGPGGVIADTDKILITVTERVFISQASCKTKARGLKR